MPICVGPHNSTWLQSYAKKQSNSQHNRPQQNTTPNNPCKIVMERIVLVGFLPDGNGRSCELHPFGCGNSLVVNRADGGVGLRLRLRSFVKHELACYTINSDGSDGCRVGFTARAYASGENDLRLDGAIVVIVAVSTADHENRSMRRLFHQNRGYAYADVLSYAN
jgi:hypothetical protein